MKPESARNLPPIYRLPDKTVLAKKVISDFVVIFILLLGIILFYAVGQPFHRGFNCDDDSIRYPYRNNTISGTANYLYSTLIPAGTFAVNEFFIIRSHFSAHSDALRQPLFWRFYGWQVYLQLIPLGFAATTSQFLTDVSKYSIGRLRPHFIDLCRPQLPNGLVMDRFSNCQNPHTYVTEYTCFKDNLSMSSRKMKDVRLSFMSGHSSFAAVCLVYLVLYLHLRMRAAHLALVKHLYQAALLYLVFYTGMSRISDYKHHWSDVLCGLLQGTLVAILVAYFVGDLVKPRSYENMQQITVGQLMSGSSSGTNGGSSATNGDSSSNGAFKDIHQVESGV